MVFEQERREVAYWVRRIYWLRLTTASGGNVSRRAGDNLVAISSSGTDKARIRPEQVAIVDMGGKNMTPEVQPSSEGRMHLRIYQALPHIQAIIHAHPATASAFAAADTPIDLGMLAETYALVDPPVMAPYALSGTQELADIVAGCAARSSSILLQNHAVLTTGANLMQAFSRLELLEEAARITLLCRQLEGVRRLSAAERADLDKLVGRSEAGNP